MRVLQLTTDLRFSGAERAIVNLVRGLRSRGVQCAVAGLFQGAEREGRTARILGEEGVPVHSANIRHKWLFWRAAGLRRFARGWRPDIVHAHLFHGNVAGALLRRAGVGRRLIWTHHGLEGSRLRGLVERALAGAADAQVFVSRAVRDRQHKVAGASARERVIANGLDLVPFARVRPAEGHTVVALGRLHRVKGFDVLLGALPHVLARVPDARLRIGGEGRERPRLEALARRLGIAERVELVGFVHAPAEFLAGGSVFAMPSRAEGFGLTLAEALAVGLPCVASRVGALPEVAGRCATWVPAGEARALGEAIADAMQSGPGDVAARRARAGRFSAEAATDAWLALYRELL